MKPFIFTDITFLPDSKWVTVLLLIFLTTGFNTFEPNAAEDEFYLPADPEYSIVDSVMDSIRFTMTRTLTRCDQGHLASKSSFVNPEGEIMHWHDFGDLEGPGWAANAAGGAREVYRLADFMNQPEWKEQALEVLDHVLEHGFIDWDSGFIKGYRNTQSNELCLNYKGNSDWFCPGSMAKIAFQLLLFADTIADDPRSERMKTAAVKCARWIDRHVDSTPNGWFPRRCSPNGKTYKLTPEGGNDAFWQTSADGLFILQLQTALTQRGLADYTDQIREKCGVFMQLGGIFGSINHDTYDPHENVAYSVAFRTLLPASRLLGDEEIRRFAYETCLNGLEQFKMKEDRNGVKTKGLLYMEKSWDTSYLWENAEAALAYFEAALDLREQRLEESRKYEKDGIVILRAISRHHYGPYGFLTEGVDWNNHVGQQHHIAEALYGAIQYTEPFLNNQHITEPTLFYLEKLAHVENNASGTEWRDFEDTLLFKQR
ncbi:MAG: hypothetical protein ACOX5R_19935 [bacterium]|jgi:hypothetical protein